MRRSSLFLALVGVWVTPALALAQDVNGFEPRTFQGSKGLTLPYRLFKVKNPTAGMKYPLVLFLHGAGERGNNNTSQLMANQGATVWASDTHQAEHPAYVVAPQCPNDQQWVDTPWAEGSYMLDNVPVSDELATALEIVADVAAEFETDTGRQYITGLSMGGFGTWDAIMRNPTLFAAAVPVCGGADPTKATLLEMLPIWTAHGDADGTVPVKGTQDMVAALKAAGSTVKYSEYPGVGHDAWSQTYANEEVIDWMFTNMKPAPPVGGAGGAGGMAGAGGAAGAGGGSAGAGGNGGVGGSSGGTGAGSPAGGSAGSASVGGSAMAGSGTTPGTTPPSEDSGCSFGGPARSSAPSGGWLLLAGFVAFGYARARQRRVNTAV